MADSTGILAYEVEKAVFTASQWRLVWLTFVRHKLAVASAVFLILGYLSSAFADFVAPYPTDFRNDEAPFVPPMRVHLRDTDGRFHRPFVYALELERDPVTLRPRFREVTDRRYPIRFLVQGAEYEMWGLIRSRMHLFGVDEGAYYYLLGTDKQGRDILTRTVFAGRISLTIGLIGVTISFVLAIVFGSISGYFGGVPDMVIQRIIEVLTSLPQLPLWMALAVAIPISWPIERVFFAITVILSLISWPGLAREVRGKVLALRETDYVTAARIDNAGTPRLLFQYLVPGVLSHLIASLTLAIPNMILGETALSFLGVGLRAPAISWGVLLQQAQNIQTVALSPWLMTPVFAVILVILAFNFVGDGLRDAADPYKS